MFSSGPLHLMLVCLLSLGIHAQELDLSISVDINIDDPCDDHQCLPGEKCETVYTPQLIQLPVAHCISQIDENKQTGPCAEYTVLTNFISCKTEGEWRRIGNSQCALRDNQTQILTKTQVKYDCQSFHSSTERKYMSATYTCCSEKHAASPQPSAKPSKTPSEDAAPSEDTKLYKPHDPQPVSDQPAEEDKHDLPVRLIPLLLGVTLLIAVIAVVMVIWQRRRATSAHNTQKPRMEFATSFVNPDADQTETNWVINPLDSTDKSLLIVNEDTSPSK